MNTTSTFKKILIALAILVVPIMVTYGINNFITTQRFIDTENVKLELFNATMPYLYPESGTPESVDGIPADYSKTINGVYIYVVEGSKYDFTAVAVNIGNPDIQYCIDSTENNGYYTNFYECDRASLA